jgi:pimeloyl-ACP methyl ester carboxylesterase
MPTLSKPPDTIVLVHGFWVTPRSWEHWITRYEARGYRVLAPAYPRFEAEVEALNRGVISVEFMRTNPREYRRRDPARTRNASWCAWSLGSGSP